MSNARHGLTTVILAAGAAQRFGSCKHLLLQEGKSLLQHRVDAVRQAGLSNPFIITGAWHNAMQQAVPNLNLHYHRNWKKGLGSSIAFAMDCIPDTAQGVLLLLGDQVAITGEHIAQLLRNWEESGNVVCAHYQGAPGVPAIFPRSQFPALRKLEGDKGAKALLKAQARALQETPMPSAAIDIDTPDDWLRWQNTSNKFTGPLTEPLNSGDTLWN